MGRRRAGLLGAAGRAGQWAGFPDATNTGHTAWSGWSGSLTPYAGTDPIRAVGSNQTFEGYSFEGITVGASGDAPDNVTFRGCRFRSSWNEGWNVKVLEGTNIRFEYCTIEPLSSQAVPVTFGNSYQLGIDIRGNASVTAENCNIWGFGNAFQIETSSASFPVVVRDCYIHDAADQAGSTYHHDGFLSSNGGPTHIILDHNTIFSGGNTNAVALQSIGTPYDQITITNNLLGGFGYTVNIADQYGVNNTNIVFEDNVFTTASPLPNFGPLKITWPGLANNCSWRRNRWRYGGNGDPAADGKYWHPYGGVVGNWNNLTEVVSTEDYTG